MWHLRFAMLAACSANGQDIYSMLLIQTTIKNATESPMADGNSQGFTLPELIATVAIAAILLMVGVPSLLRLINSSAITGYADELTGTLALARSEAIVEKNTVTICKSADLLDCDNTVSWTDGWIVFLDADEDHTVDLPDDRIIKVHEALAAQVTLKFNFAFSQYIYTGFIKKIPTQTGAGTFTFCPANNDASLARGVIVAGTGRTRNSMDSDSDGVHEDGSGNPLTCP
ncbi:MAG: GspH/FimT family pseudopilin [Pseudomonadales bacterium]|nr:GspH/FimT family pseudopilin [Pseudomonadales bacterium]